MGFARRIDSVLGEPALRVRSSVRVTPKTLIVGAHNPAALVRARLRLAREVGLPQAMLAYRVWIPAEVDGPVSPPRSAYLAVLDTIAAAPSERGRPFVLDARSLPRSLGEDDLRRRGLRLQLPADDCNTVTVVSFLERRQFVSGVYWFSLGWRANNYYYEVRCESGTCRVTGSGLLGGLKIVACPARRQ